MSPRQTNSGRSPIDNHNDSQIPVGLAPGESECGLAEESAPAIESDQNPTDLSHIPKTAVPPARTQPTGANRDCSTCIKRDSELDGSALSYNFNAMHLPSLSAASSTALQQDYYPQVPMQGHQSQNQPQHQNHLQAQQPQSQMLRDLRQSLCVPGGSNGVGYIYPSNSQKQDPQQQQRKDYYQSDASLYSSLTNCLLPVNQQMVNGQIQGQDLQRVNSHPSLSPSISQTGLQTQQSQQQGQQQGHQGQGSPSYQYVNSSFPFYQPVDSVGSLPLQPDGSLNMALPRSAMPVPATNGMSNVGMPGGGLPMGVFPGSSPIQSGARERLVRLSLRKRGSRKKSRGSLSSQGSAGSNSSTGHGSSTSTGGKSRRKHKIGRPLNPKTRVRLTLVPNLLSLHSMLVPTHRADSFRVLQRGDLNDELVREELIVDPSVEWKFRPNQQGELFPGRSQTVVLVNSNYVPSFEESLDQGKDVRFPGAIGFERSKEMLASGATGDGSNRGSNSGSNGGSGSLLDDDDAIVPIYNDFSLVMKDVFQTDGYSLVRVTRAAAFERSGAIVLKLETAHPGDTQLNDEDAVVDNSRGTEEDNQFLGNKGDAVGPLFVKKKIARPRYKANMRIYVLPRTTEAILYSQENMLKRDLLKGILDLRNDSRMVLCAFDYTKVLKELDMM